MQISLFFTLLVLTNILNAYSVPLEDNEFQNITDFFSDVFNTSDSFILTRQGLQGSAAMPEAIRKNGYPYEIHDIVTEDGYILTTFRIPFGLQRGVPRRKPVLFHHGLISDSTSWLLNRKENILALQLADLGFDVWLANCRGTTYSRKHKTLTVKDKKFFEYSMDEIGLYDVPAEIDYILQTTGHEKLIFVGHSMGGAAILIALSNRPEYNEKVCLVAGFAPAVSVCQGSPAKYLLQLIGPYIAEWGLGLVTNGAGQLPFTFLGKIIVDIIKAVCEIQGMRTVVCPLIWELAVGGSFGAVPEAVLPALEVHPSPSSIRIVKQFVQFIITGKFEKYNYGRSMNTKIYGTPKTPVHNLRHVTAPVALFGGNLDNGVGTKDITRISEALPNVVLVHRMTYWNHFDFVVGKKINEKLNVYVKELFLKY